MHRLASLVLLALVSNLSSAASGDTPQKIDEVIPAKVIERKAPKYPVDAARNGQEGWVRVSYVIGKDGSVIDPVVTDSSGVRGFEKATLKALKRWEYEPATRDGEAIQQCRMEVQMDFVLDRTPSGVRRKFRSLYMDADEALRENDLDKATEIVARIHDNKIWNRYENAWFWMLDANLANALGESKRELASLRRAVASNEGDQYLGEALYLNNLHRMFVLQLGAAQYTKALDTFDKISEHKNGAEITAALDEMAREVEAYLNSDQPLIAKQVVDTKGEVWYPLYRSAFSVIDINGSLSSLDIRCQNQRVKYTVESDSLWKIPTSWGSCSVLFEGEPGTTFGVAEVSGDYTASR